jgi:hypothetical protein
MNKVNENIISTSQKESLIKNEENLDSLEIIKNNSESEISSDSESNDENSLDFEEEDIIKKTNKNKEMELKDFFNQNRQYFIMTEGGTPIYSRYSDEMKICGLLATFSAIITKFTIFNKYKDNIEKLNYICNGKSIIVFLKEGKLFLIAVSQSNDSISLLYSQLKLLYYQLLSIITKPGIPNLEEKPSNFNFILEKKMYLFEQIIEYSSHSLTSLIDCYQILPIENRNKFYEIISKNKNEFVLCCLFDNFANKLISLCKASFINFTFSDIVLIQNLIMFNNSIKNFEIFENLCIPGISDQGPLQIYSNFNFDNVGIVFICENDTEEIKKKYQVLSKKIYEEIKLSNSLIQSLKNHSNSFFDCNKEDNELDNFKLKSIFIHYNEENRLSKSLEKAELKNNDLGINLLKNNNSFNSIKRHTTQTIDISGYKVININNINNINNCFSVLKYSLIINIFLNQFFTINISSYNKITAQEKYIYKVYTKLFDLYKCQEKNEKNFHHFEKDNSYNHIIYVQNHLIIIATFNIFKTYEEILNNIKKIIKIISNNENYYFIQIK